MSLFGAGRDRELEREIFLDDIATAVKKELSCVVCGELNIQGNHNELMHGMKLKLNKKRKREKK